MKNKLLYTFYSFFFVTSSVIAETNLDQQMSLQDKQQTGIVNLTLKQRQALGMWIDHHYQPINDTSSTESAELQNLNKSSIKPPLDNPVQYMLVQNLGKGQELILSDRSQWIIHPEDLSISQGWKESTKISIEHGFDAGFPFILMNLDTHQSVKARLWTKEENPTPQASTQENSKAGTENPTKPTELPPENRSASPAEPATPPATPPANAQP